MTENNYFKIEPTRLYYKQCSHCELKYYGKSTTENIEAYKGSGIRWLHHLKKHNATAIHVWNSEWFYDTSIIEVAMKFSFENNIVESDEWANLVIENGIDGGYLGEKANQKMSKTRADPVWKETVGKESVEKMLKTRADPVWKETVGKKLYKKILETRADPVWQETVGKKSKEKEIKTKSDPIWKETVGKQSIEAYKKTISDPLWKETVGKKAIESFKKTKSDPIWKETVGKKSKEKELKTKSDPIWKETVGKESIEKGLKTRADPVWKEKNAKVCPHCSVKMDSGNYAKWHGDKCRHKPNIFIGSINL
jgi:hypothetical protein